MQVSVSLKPSSGMNSGFIHCTLIGWMATEKNTTRKDLQFPPAGNDYGVIMPSLKNNLPNVISSGSILFSQVFPAPISADQNFVFSPVPAWPSYYVEFVYSQSINRMDGEALNVEGFATSPIGATIGMNTNIGFTSTVNKIAPSQITVTF